MRVSARRAAPIRFQLAALTAAVLALAPSTVQADPVVSQDCRAELSGEVGQRTATLTIACDTQRINGAQFRPSRPDRPGATTNFRGEEPGHGLACTSANAGFDFFCFGRLDPGEVGTAEVGVDTFEREPCVRDSRGVYAIEDLTLSTGPRAPGEAIYPDVRFDDISIRCTDDGGGQAECTVRGGPGNDVLRGTARADVICGGGGNDIVYGLAGDDIVRGGGGNDIHRGGAGDDRLSGGPGRDVLRGETGDDSLTTTDGRRGNDVAHGGSGADSCSTDRNDARSSC